MARLEWRFVLSRGRDSAGYNFPRKSLCPGAGESTFWMSTYNTYEGAAFWFCFQYMGTGQFGTGRLVDIESDCRHVVDWETPTEGRPAGGMNKCANPVIISCIVAFIFILQQVLAPYHATTWRYVVWCEMAISFCDVMWNGHFILWCEMWTPQGQIFPV